MSESPNSDDSVPSLSSYPPSFVSLITTFIKRAEEAETRAYKTLVILKAKDEQVIQLQQRMAVLEKIACRLEEIMVPPLDLPRSPLSFNKLSSPHPRDADESNRQSIETLYERHKVPHEKEHSRIQDSHNCYEKCQFLIDGLERSNCQLREALTAESQQRVKDHEEYVVTLAKATQMFKDQQNKNSYHTEYKKDGLSRGYNLNVAEEIDTVNKAAGDTVESVGNKADFRKNDCSISSDQNTTFDTDYFKTNEGSADNFISVLQCRSQTCKKKNNKRNEKLESVKKEKLVDIALSKQSLSSYHTPKSSCSVKKRIHILSSHYFLNALKKQNKKLKRKYYLVCEKFAESLTLCEKLQKERICCSSKSRKSVESRVDQSTQTTQSEDLYLFTLPTTKNYGDKTQSSRSSNILQGRLEAAAKVMAKQCKQIQELQKQLAENLGQVDSLKKRLVRAETAAAGNEVLGETTKKQLEESEKKNLTLLQEMQQIKDTCSRLRQELALKNDECSKIKTEKDISESELKGMKISLEQKLFTLTSALQQKEQYSGQMVYELESKLSNLREQFVAQVTEASDRLVTADFKIQELYLGVETFLKLLFAVNSPELTPSSQAQAVQVASDILQLPPAEVQTILHTSRHDLRVSRWIRECNRMVHEKVFAKNLGNLLLDAVLEAKIT